MTATVNDQSITITDESLTVSESVGIYECDFTFDASWDTWNKTAVFEGAGETIEMIVVDNKAQIPWEVLKEAGWIKIGVYGTKGGEVKPTIWSDQIYVAAGTVPGSVEVTPTPSIYAQILDLANDAKDIAEDAQDTADDVASDWANVSATATTLSAGSPATVTFADNTFAFGIPKGAKGDTGATGATGATPDFSIGTVSTLETGQPATATITGTAAAPVLNLGLPKGNKGDNGDVANIADAYSTSATYAVGDYCIYNSQLYRCTTAITTAEAWTAAHWTVVQLGDDVGDLRSAFMFSTSYSIPVMQGYFGIADGEKASSYSWCCSDYLDKNCIITSDTIKLFLLAYNINGTYIGAWNGSEFSKTFASDGYMMEVNVKEWMDKYPSYRFKVDYYTTGASLTPSDVVSAITVTDYSFTKQDQIEVDSFNTLKNDLILEQGYYSVETGKKEGSANWCRSNYVNQIYEMKTSGNLKLILLAFESDGTYIGAWNGTQFVKASLAVSMYQTYLNFGEVLTNYPNYLFAVNFYTGSAITPTSVKELFTIKNLSIPVKMTIDISEVNKRILFPVKQGEVFIISSLTEDILPVAGKLMLYDSNGNYLNYYGLGGEHSRTVTSSINFTYIAIDGISSVNMNIQKNEQFDKFILENIVKSIGKNNGDAVDLKEKNYIYKKELDESKAFVLKYGGYAPVNCDARFLWITDLHGESSRMEHCADVVKTFGTGIIPFVLNTGDTVSDVMSDGITWYNSVVSEMSVPVLNTVGNHDTYVTNGVPTEDQTDVYDEVIAPFVSGWSVTQPQNASANGYCYYYKDIGKIRLIVLDSMYWDAIQKTWFEGILSDANTNYKHVLIACHSPFHADLCTMVDSRWNTGWLSRDITLMDEEAMESVKDFLDDGGTLVGWLQGHVHGDEIVTVDNGRQLAICANSFANRGTKVPKVSDSQTYNYNSYTLVAVDADNHYLKLLRIGADISISGKKHDGFVWDYVNNTVVADW